MSVARVQTSKFAARLGATLACGKCRRPIEKGESYRWFKVGFRTNYRHIRCNRSECFPRMSELESSLMSGAYSAIEGAEDTLASLEAGDPGTYDDIESAVRESADGVNEVATQYRDAADAMGSAGEDMENKASELEDIASTLEQFDVDEQEPDLNHDGSDDEDHDAAECDECRDLRTDWWSNQISAARDALGEVNWP